MEINFADYYETEPEIKVQEIIKKYFDNKSNINKEDQKKLREYIEKVIAREKSKVGKDEKYKFSTLISFISLAPLDSFDFYPVEKTLKVFNSIENFYFLHTKESKDKAKELEKELKKSNYNVSLLEVDTGNYDQIYYSLEKIISYEKYGKLIPREKFLIDNTQGMKMASAAFSKFGIEQGIRLVTWQNEQMENKNGRLDRLPGTETLYFNKAPEMANYTSYTAIDKLLSNYEFNAASKIYEALNNKEMSNLFEILSEIYSYDNIDTYDDFIDSIKKSRIFRFKSTDKKFEEALEKLKLFFRMLINESLEKEYDLNNLMENYKTKDFSADCWLTFEQKEKLYKFIYIDYVLKSYNQKYLADLILSAKFENENWDLHPLKFHPDMDKDDFIKELDINEGLESIIYTLYSPEEMFKKNLERGITLFNGQLTIPEKEINGINIKNLKTDKKCAAVLTAILENQNYDIKNDNEVYFKEETISLENFIVPVNHSNPSIARKRFKEAVDKTNKEIKIKTAELGKEVTELIRFDTITHEKGGKYYYKISLCLD
jgi:hypothetical protein